MHKLSWLVLLPVLLTGFSLSAQHKKVLPDTRSIAENHPSIDQEIPAFALLESDLHAYKIFLSGETHGVGINPYLQFEWLKYLHEHCGVRNLILELPLSYGYYLNQYLESGDSAILYKTIYNGILGSVISSMETHHFFTQLHHFNQKIDKANRIKLYCIDVEHRAYFTFGCLSELLSKGTPNQGLDPIILKLTLWAKEKKAGIETTEERINFLKNDLLDQSRSYKAALGESYATYYRILKNLNNTYKDNREENLYDNFMEQTGSGVKGKYFGQLGGLHVINKKRLLKKKTFAEKLNYNKKSPFRNEVLSIMYIYQNCGRINYPGRYTLGLIEPESFTRITEVDTSNFSFFNVRTGAHMLEAEAKHYHYLLLIKNQEAMRALRLKDY